MGGVERVEGAGGHVRIVELGVALRVNGDHVPRVLAAVRLGHGVRVGGVAGGGLDAVELADPLGHIGGQGHELGRVHGCADHEVGVHGIVDDIGDRGPHGGGDDRPRAHQGHADDQGRRRRRRPAGRRREVARRQPADGPHEAQRYCQNGDGPPGEHRGGDEQAENEGPCADAQHGAPVRQVRPNPGGYRAGQARGRHEHPERPAQTQRLLPRPRGSPHGLHRRGEGGVARRQEGADDGHEQADDDGDGDYAGGHGHPSGQGHSVGLQADHEQAGQAGPARDADERSGQPDDDGLEEHRGEHGGG